jgi:osmoprotectant transport system ATP-binding protein
MSTDTVDKNEGETCSSRRMKPTIQFREVTYSVTRKPSGASDLASTFDIVSDISLQINAGETVVLLGRSGSGKTTLLRLINRLLVPQKGAVFVQDRATSDWDPIALRRGIGYVIQEGGLFPHFTVAENVALVPSLEKWEPERTSKRVRELLELVGLDPGQFADRRPNQLSGGQRQRVGVARALAADPPILLMDEPFGALDPVTRAEMQREFADIARRLGKTIVFVTHDLREARRLATRIVLLQSGRIVASSAPDEFLRIDHPEVRAFATTLDTNPADQRSPSQVQSEPPPAPGARA